MSCFSGKVRYAKKLPLTERDSTWKFDSENGTSEEYEGILKYMFKSRLSYKPTDASVQHTGVRALQF